MINSFLSSYDVLGRRSSSSRGHPWSDACMNAIVRVFQGGVCLSPKITGGSDGHEVPLSARAVAGVAACSALLL